MRTFVSWRFWLALVALAGMTFGLLHLTRDEGSAAAEPQQEGGGPQEREIDLIGPVFLVQADPGTQIVDGVTTGRIQVRVDGFRYMNIGPGTPGENRCPATTELASCVVAADLLGEAVLWFSLLPAEPRNQVTLPAIVALREDGNALLTNGWIVPHASTVERECDDDVLSMSEFLREHAQGSTSTFSLEEQAIVSVRCAGTEPISEPTTPPATVPPANR